MVESKQEPIRDGFKKLIDRFPIRENSGIYAIRHIETGKMYIGSSRHISDRWIIHCSCLRLQKHHSVRLQSD